MKQNSSNSSFIIYEIITTLIAFLTFCLSLFFIFLFFLTSNYLFFLPKLAIIYLGIYIIMYRVNRIRGLPTSTIEDLSKGDNVSKKTSTITSDNTFKIQLIFLVNIFIVFIFALYNINLENNSEYLWIFLLILVVFYTLGCIAFYFNCKIIKEDFLLEPNFLKYLNILLKIAVLLFGLIMILTIPFYFITEIVM